MDESSAFLRRLRCIADSACSREERQAQALALLQAYTARLYGRLNIGGSNRVTAPAKRAADQTLAALRLQVLTAEVGTAGPAVAVFTAVRHRIEMLRRALALRLLEEDEASQPAHAHSAAVVTMRPTANRSMSKSAMSKAYDDWRVIEALRSRVIERKQVQGKAAVEGPLRVLGRHAPRCARLIVLPRSASRE